MIRTRPRGISTAAAFFALLLLSFASVQSIVMQAATAPSGAMMPMCGKVDPSNAVSVAMAGVDMQPAVASSTHDQHQGAPQQHQAACPYCAVAGHAPMLAQAVPLRHATQCVFTVFQQVPGIGPRGPPARQPHARGPPSDHLTA
jgi:hypothetical protein